MITLIEFADLVDENLVITYHPNQGRRFSCDFDGGDIKEGIFLSSTFGNGHTPEEAMDSYAREISNKTIVFHATSDTLRREYHVPVLSTNGIVR